MLAAILCNLDFRAHHRLDPIPGDYREWMRSVERRRLRKPEQMQTEEIAVTLKRLMLEAPPEVATAIVEQLTPALRTETGINWAAFLADMANVSALLALYERLLGAYSEQAMLQRVEAQRLLLLRALAAAEEFDRQATLQFLGVFNSYL